MYMYLCIKTKEDAQPNHRADTVQVRGALCQIRGDWAFYTEVFKFPTWNGALSMCWMCRASSTLKPLLFTDFSAGAGWRRTRWSHETYVQYLRFPSSRPNNHSSYNDLSHCARII